MKKEELNRRLSSIQTSWTVLQQAHAGAVTEVAAAQKLLVERYGRAVHRYLLAALRDPHAADELTQEFALALLRGEFRRADPQRGRFRNYIKTALFHLVSKYRKKEQKLPTTLPDDSGELDQAPAQEAVPEFDSSWRDELLARTWDALADVQPLFAAVLRYRAEHPSLPSAEMAGQLTQKLGKPLTADGVRQTLRRARDKFAELLLNEVAQSLETPTADLVGEELAELGLLEYCRPALDQRRSTE